MIRRQNLSKSEVGNLLSSCHRIPRKNYIKFNIIQAVINGLGKWLSATIERVIAVKNRSHNLKTTDIKLQSFFFDLTGRVLDRRPAFGGTTDTLFWTPETRIQYPSSIEHPVSSIEYPVSSNQYPSILPSAPDPGLESNLRDFPAPPTIELTHRRYRQPFAPPGSCVHG